MVTFITTNIYCTSLRLVHNLDTAHIVVHAVSSIYVSCLFVFMKLHNAIVIAAHGCIESTNIARVLFKKKDLNKCSLSPYALYAHDCQSREDHHTQILVNDI